jgi:hypothetical protein
MISLSKSKYCGLWQCPKIAWLKKYKPEKWVADESTEKRMTAGNEIGDLAMGLFGDYVEISARYDDGKLDLSEMIKMTQEEMSKNTPIICEASFCYNGLFCAVDILRKNTDGWDIYEVKSSSMDEDDDFKQVYIADIAYQKYVLKNCGITIKGTYLICLNKRYVLEDNLDIHKLFLINDVAAEVFEEEQNIAGHLAKAEEVLNSPTEPDIDLSINCKEPYSCGFWEYCSKQKLPSPSVFDIRGLSFKKKVAFYRDGDKSFEDVRARSDIKNRKQLQQIDYQLENKGTYVDKVNISLFLSKLSYPLYFLDFESMQTVIPIYKGTHPYAQIPFQYSLHYITDKGGELMHKEFLAESGPDPRRALAEQLCSDIPLNVTTLAYNRSFERMIINELAEVFPDLKVHLLNIHKNIKDLLEPFRNRWYYNKEMQGSYSIKNVLPAVFPNDPALDYHNLEDIQNGGDAMTIFPKIEGMGPLEREKARNNLLKYCGLDTYAMVKLWQELVRVTEGE